MGRRVDVCPEGRTLTYQAVLDDPSVDTERAAIACSVAAATMRSLALGLGVENSHYEWFADSATRLENHVHALRLRQEGPASARVAELRLVVSAPTQLAG